MHKRWSMKVRRASSTAKNTTKTSHRLRPYQLHELHLSIYGATHGMRPARLSPTPLFPGALARVTQQHTLPHNRSQGRERERRKISAPFFSAGKTKPNYFTLCYDYKSRSTLSWPCWEIPFISSSHGQGRVDHNHPVGEVSGGVQRNWRPWQCKLQRETRTGWAGGDSILMFSFLCGRGEGRGGG